MKIAVKLFFLSASVLLLSQAKCFAQEALYNNMSKWGRIEKFVKIVDGDNICYVSYAFHANNDGGAGTAVTCIKNNSAEKQTAEAEAKK